MSVVPYTVKERVQLPVFNEAGHVVDSVAKQPGDTITKAELHAAKQTDEDVARLAADGAIEAAS